MIAFHRPHYGRRARTWIDEALQSESLHGAGVMVRRVEQLLSELLNSRVLLTASATSALEVAARVAGFGPGDEVIVPAFTFASCAGSISAVGATPVFVDVTASNLCIDLDCAERAVTSRTKGVVVVHYAGQSCDLDRLQVFTGTHGLTVIEDAAQAFFCQQGLRRLGTVGHLSCISFQNGKVLSCGEGGALVVNDSRFFDAAVRILDKGTDYRRFLAGGADNYGWVCQGTSEFMSGLPAALLGSQLEELREIIEARQRIFDRYDEELRPLAGRRGWRVITRAPHESLSSPIYWMICRDVDERRAFTGALERRGIPVFRHFQGLHRSAYAREMGWEPAGPLPVTEQAAEALVRLPLHTSMTDDEVERVIGAVKDFWQAESPVTAATS